VNPRSQVPSGQSTIVTRFSNESLAGKVPPLVPFELSDVSVQYSVGPSSNEYRSRYERTPSLQFLHSNCDCLALSKAACCSNGMTTHYHRRRNGFRLAGSPKQLNVTPRNFGQPTRVQCTRAFEILKLTRYRRSVFPESQVHQSLYACAKSLSTTTLPARRAIDVGRVPAASMIPMSHQANPIFKP